MNLNDLPEALRDIFCPRCLRAGHRCHCDYDDSPTAPEDQPEPQDL